MNHEHAFAPFVRILGKGKKGSRSLEREEALEAFGMILDGEVRPEQLGAFLMLLRVKEEAPQELAGFVEAVKQRFVAPEHLEADLDWSSYAGKKNHLPWFLLSALVLAENGIRVFMHGATGHTAGRIYTEHMLPELGLQKCMDWTEVEQQLKQRNFAYMAIDQLCAPLGEIIQLRNILGLRSPVHTLCRLLNPLNSQACIDGVFHPPYGPMHQKTSAMLGVANSVTIKGDGGEAELKPDSDSQLQWVTDGQLSEERWPRLYQQRLVKDANLSPDELLSLWRGEIEHQYGEGAVINTLAVALKLLKKETDVESAVARAEEMWRTRNRKLY